MLGNLLVILNTMLFGVFITYSEWLCSQYNPQQVAAWSFAVATVCVTVASLSFDASSWLRINDAPLSAWGSIVYAALVATAFAYGYALIVVVLVLVHLVIHSNPTLDIDSSSSSSSSSSLSYGRAINWSLKQTTPIVAMAWEPMQPLSAAILGMFVLDEPIGWWFAGGFVLIMIGLVRAGTTLDIIINAFIYVTDIFSRTLALLCRRV